MDIFWFLPLVMVLAIVIWALWAIVRRGGGSGGHKSGRTIVDK